MLQEENNNPLNLNEFYDINPTLDSSLFIKYKKVLLANLALASDLFFKGNKEQTKEYKSLIIDSKNQEDVINNVVVNFVYDCLIKNSFTSVEANGLEQLNKDKCYVFITTHRDIVLDCLLVGCLLGKSGCKIAYPVVGSNLLFSSFSKACFYMLKSTIINRELDVRKLYEQSIKISSFISYCISSNYSSVWIAAGAGRSKNGIDIVKPSLIKMLYLSKKSDGIKNFLDKISFVPVSISYEKDPNDVLKTVQFLDKKYKKLPSDDALSIKKGLIENKKRVVVNFSHPLTSR